VGKTTGQGSQVSNDLEFSAYFRIPLAKRAASSYHTTNRQPSSSSSPMNEDKKMKVAPRAKLRRKRLSEELTAQLRKHIIDKGLKPGDPLLTEQEMMQQFGVSRSVVREATKALDFLGIISAVPSRGMVLDDFDFNCVSEYFGFHFALSDYPKSHLLKARLVVETGSLYYVMEEMRKKPELYSALKKLAEEGPVTNDSSREDWIEHDIAFHRALVGASGIAPLASFCDLLQAFFHKFRGRLQGLPGGKPTHIEIVECLRAGKLDKAIDLLRGHVRHYAEDDDESP
jgi:GntR family transcriptional regulator, transcriptional repressor for pyruvate dehydrogenase complex